MSVFFGVLRFLSLLMAGLWLGVSGWNWWGNAGYDVCGISVRLMGFCFWGVLLLLLPLVLALPPIKADGGGLNWRAAMPGSVAVVLCGWSLLLAWLIPNAPAACAEGDILAAAGLLWGVGACAGACVLAGMTSLLKGVFLLFRHVRLPWSVCGDKRKKQG